MTYGDQVLFCHINVAPARHTVRDTQLLFKAEFVCVFYKEGMFKTFFGSSKCFMDQSSFRLGEIFKSGIKEEK